MSDADTKRLHEILNLTPDIAQLMDGWHQDGTAWTEWDESVRSRLSEWHKRVTPEQYAAAGWKEGAWRLR